jgi:DNA-binding winged helix-turn-helix (wHTH) protein
MLAEGNYKLGPFLVDCDHRKIFRGDVEVPVHWRSFQALRALIAAGNEVVDRNRLIDLLWSGAVVEESNLHKYISQLRKALNETDSAQEYIETVPRIGYRLAVPAQKLADDAPEPVHEVRADTTTRARASGRVAFVLVAVAICSAGLIALARWDGRPTTQASPCEQGYKTGMDLLRRRDFLSMRSGTDELRRVVESCPEFAKGWAGLAEASAFLHAEDTTACLKLAERSVRVGPRCGECRAILGFVLFSRHWRWKEAKEHLSEAVLLAPDDPQARYWLAQWEAAQGRPDKALEAINEALKKSPQGMNLLVMKAGCLYLARDFAGALEVADQALAVNLPAAWAWRSKTLFQMGRHAEAVRSLAFSLGSWSSRSAEAIALRSGELTKRYQEAGLKGPLGDLLEHTANPEAAAMQSLNRAEWFMLLGNSEAALRELDVAVRVRMFDLIYLKLDPLYDPIRGHPRFHDILQKIGLG